MTTTKLVIVTVNSFGGYGADKSCLLECNDDYHCMVRYFFAPLPGQVFERIILHPKP